MDIEHLKILFAPEHQMVIHDHIRAILSGSEPNASTVCAHLARNPKAQIEYFNCLTDLVTELGTGTDLAERFPDFPPGEDIKFNSKAQKNAYENIRLGLFPVTVNAKYSNMEFKKFINMPLDARAKLFDEASTKLAGHNIPSRDRRYLEHLIRVMTFLHEQGI